MKKNFIRLFSILFLVLSFTNCKTTQTESDPVENTKDKNNRAIVLYDRNAKETYYLEDEKEIKKVLALLPKIPNVVYDIKHVLEWGLFGPYPKYFMQVKKNGKVTKEVFISTEEYVWYTDKSVLTVWIFPKKNIEKIISKMHKGIKHTETIEDLTERRQFIEGLRADDNVLYIDLRRDFDLRMGSFYIYVPSSEDENIDSREIEDNLREHYGDTVKTRNKAIHNYSFPKRTRYIEETQEIEFEMRWTKEMYDKIDIYRKSEFREENYKTHQTFDYYTKE